MATGLESVTERLSLAGEIDYTRQRDWYDPVKQPARVTIVGCGGIGSPTALALCKLGIAEFVLCDPDSVEPHNIPNQIYRRDDVGQHKVDALADMIEAFGACNVTTHATPFSECVSSLRGVVVSALDSMAARTELCSAVEGYKTGCELLIDCRIGGEIIVLYTVRPHDPDDLAAYKETLYSDQEAVDLPCTRRAVMDVGFFASALITNVIRRHLAGELVPRQIYCNASDLALFSPTGAEL